MYGIKQGGSGFYGNSHVSNVESTNNSETLKTQEQLAAQMEISVDTLQNYKLLSERTPKVSDSLNQEQLDILSSTGFSVCDILSCTETVITLYGEYYNRLSSCTTKTI